MKMKKQMILSAVALMSAMAAISCTGGFESEEYGFSGSIALEEGRTDTLTVDIRMEYPAKGMSAQAMESLRDIITAEAFGNGYCGKAPQEAIDAYASDYISTYRDENLELAESLAGENSMALSWGKYITGAFTGEMNMADGDRLMNYTITDYSYTGGAHGRQHERLAWTADETCFRSIRGPIGLWLSTCHGHPCNRKFQHIGQRYHFYLQPVRDSRIRGRHHPHHHPVG